jgi:NAD-dependent SIR2 family protein deacetylase
MLVALGNCCLNAGCSAACSAVCVRIAITGGNMVIINKQKTPYDDKADLRIFANCDEAS